MTWLGADTYTYHEVTFDDGVLVVRFDQPEALNPFTLASMNELALALNAAAHNPDIRVLVLTGTGRAFSAGGNAKAMGERKDGGNGAHPLDRPLWNVPTMSVEERLRHTKQTGRELMLALHRLDKPTIAAVNGLAAGAGMDISLACDIRIAAAEARFAQIYVRRGLIPFDGGMFWLPRLVGLSKALELMYTGDWVDAEEALRLGLVSAVHPQDDLMPRTLELARRLASGPPAALAAIKNITRRALQLDLPQTMELTYGAAEYLFRTADHAEAMAAYAERRDAAYTGW
ncbi:enoyl-CoA hydratase/isomerase family protein [Jiangella anatolica]|uniref:Enoyl-CoA hydratase n=1 Tax=Jiangella anatolica TaxID=2670374 RepID=A0A2W2C5K7_9ACTN|nr:enoyl-CoA hydratase-related protein [Jiangella anatolica]PZF83347.1 enoyl-CoA hydratase [Jiangella anatolica]